MILHVYLTCFSYPSQTMQGHYYEEPDLSPPHKSVPRNTPRTFAKRGNRKSWDVGFIMKLMWPVRRRRRSVLIVQIAFFYEEEEENAFVQSKVLIG